MDATAIIVIVLGLVFIVGGTIVGNLATKASEKDKNETNKQEGR